MNKINTQTAEHFNWGDHCDGWFLVNKDNLCVLQEKMPAGTSEEKHYHEKTWQFFFILSGTATMEINDVTHELHSLDGIEIPPQVPHKIVNNTNQDLSFIVISMPNHKSDRVNLDE